MYRKIEYSEYNRLNETVGIFRISRTAEHDLLESVAKIGVIYNRDLKEYNALSTDAKDLFEQYFGVK